MNLQSQKKIQLSGVSGVIPIIVLFISLLLTFFSWRYAQNNVIKTTRDQFNHEVNQIEYAINQRVETYQDSLHALQGLFAASDLVERHEWGPFVKTAKIADYPDIDYINYIEIVTNENKEDFTIHPEGIKERYAVIKYIDPENEDSSEVLGFDLYSDLPRKAVLDKAADTNQPVVSETLNLVLNGSPGFFIATPVYENGKPITTVEERRAALKGFVTVALKKNNLFSDIFPVESHPDVFFTVRDGNDVMYMSEDETDGNSDVQKLHYGDKRTIEIGTRQWVLDVVSKPSFSDSYSEKGLPAVVGASGIILSLLLFLVFYFWGKRANQSIRLQSAALEAAANGVIITNTKGVILWVNPAFTKFTGYEEHEAVGQSTRILNSGKQDKAFYQHLWETILAGKVWQGEITNKRKDGSLYEEEQIISPVTNANGKITHFIAIKQDISQRKRLEEKTASVNKELEESEKAMMNILDDLNTERKKLTQENTKNEAIFASIGEGLVITDKTGKIIMVNGACEKLLGLERSVFIGKDMVDVIPKYDENDRLIPKEQRSLTQVLTGKTKKGSVSTLSATHYYIRHDKSKLPIVGVVTPIIISGEITGAVQVFRDISQEKEIDQLKDEFALNFAYCFSFFKSERS